MENVSFSIDVHETVGICYSQDNTDTVSSVGHLLQGLFPTTSGSILLDGNDVSTFNIQHLRSNIALVDKTNHFFPGSLRDNFQRILPNANNDRILWACEIANAAEQMQKLNVSPETQMEELQGIWNADLKVKLSLARALLRNPKVLILDDIFSDMDTDSILRFKATFDKISKSRTMILVSRDLHNLTVCKKLMFFNGTELAQYGPTAAILEQDGPAKNLMKKQLRVISPKFEQDYTASIKSVVS